MSKAENIEVETEEEVVKDTDVELDDLTKDDDPAKYQERINKIYGKYKQFERENDKYKEQFELMKGHNDKMLAAVERMNKEQTNQSEEKIQFEKGNQLTEEIDALKSQRIELSELGEFEKVDDLNEKISLLNIEKKDLDKKPDVQEQDKPVDPAVDAFLKSTPWINNRKMFVVACEYEMEVQSDPNWMYKSKAEQMTEVGRKTEELFNYKGNKKQNQAQHNSVEGSYKSDMGGRVVVKLTPEQVKYAKIYGVSNEAYAKQLKIMGK